MWKKKKMENYKKISRMLGCLPEALSLTSSARHAANPTWIKGKGGIKNHHIISNVIIITQVQMIVIAIQPILRKINLWGMTIKIIQLIKFVTNITRP